MVIEEGQYELYGVLQTFNKLEATFHTHTHQTRSPSPSLSPFVLFQTVAANYIMRSAAKNGEGKCFL